MNKLKKLSLVVLLIIFASLCLYFGLKSYDKQLNLIPADQLQELNSSTYELKPIDISKTGGAGVTYPIITNAYKFPYTIFYLLANSRRGVKDNLAGANRIVAKIEAWSNQLSVTNNQSFDAAQDKKLPVGDQTLVFNLENWWDKAEPMPWEVWKVKTYGSWEGFLARYYSLIVNEIGQYEYLNKTEGIPVLVKIRQNLQQNYQKVNAAIASVADVKPEDRVYLQQLANAVFNQLNKKIDRVLPQPSFSNLLYLPTEAISQNDFGQYTISLSGKLGCYSYTNTNLELTAQLANSREATSSCAFVTTDFQESEQTQDLNGITLSSSNNYLTLNYQPKNLISPTLWLDQNGRPVRNKVVSEVDTKPEINPDTGEVQVYSESYFQTLQLESTNKYYFRGYIPTEKPSVVEIRLGKTMLFSYVLPTNEELLVDQLLSLPANNSTDSAELKLITSEAIAPAKAEIAFVPVYEPTVTLAKSVTQDSAPRVVTTRLGRNSYQVTLAHLSTLGVRQVLSSAGFGWQKSPIINPDATQVSYRLTYTLANWLFVFSVLSLVIATLVFTEVLGWPWVAVGFKYLNHTRRFAVRGIAYPIKLVWRSVEQICQFLRSPLLLLALVGIVYDVFYLKSTSDTVIIYLWLTWLGAVIGWRLEGRFSFILALIFLVFCPFLLIGKNDAVAEKSAIWTYMFLLAGTIEQIIELKVKSLKLVEIETVGNFLLFQAKRAWRVYRTEGLEAFVHYLDLRLGGWFRGRREYVLMRLDVIERYSFKLPKLPIGLVVRLLVKLFRKGFMFFYQTWFILLCGVLAIILFTNMATEVNFYESFFSKAYLNELSTRLLPSVLLLWFSVLLLTTIVSKLRWYLRGPVFINALLLLIIGNNMIFGLARNRFEFNPYILNLVPDIADNWYEVKIYGRNFNDLPFKGKVLIGGVEQRTIVWSSKMISFIVDPNITKTGELVVMNDYGSKQDVKSNAVVFTYYDWRETTQELRDRYWKAVMEKARLKGITGE